MMSYPEQLESKEWKSKRTQILFRDNNTCQFCGRRASDRVTLNERVYYIGIDTNAGFITYDMLELDSIQPESTFPKDEFRSGHHAIGLQVGPDRHLLTDKGIFAYLLDLPEGREYFPDKSVYKIVRAKLPSGRYSYVYFKDEESLKQIKLPIYYCQEDMVKLHVHHKFYVIGRNAWEYSDDTLVTLCDRCHCNIHKCSDVKVYTTENGKQITMNYTPCKRCGGVGYFPEYRKVENGICFRCRGNRFEELIPNE